jgi:hypothetical protein
MAQMQDFASYAPMTSRGRSLLVESKFAMLGFMCSKLNFGVTPQRSSKIHACAIVPANVPHNLLLAAVELGVSIVAASMMQVRVPGIADRQIAGQSPTIRLALAYRRGERLPVVRAPARDALGNPGCLQHHRRRSRRLEQTRWSFDRPRQT